MTFNPSFTAVQNYTEYDLGEGVFYRMVTFPTLTDCIISDNTKEWDGNTVLIDGVGPKHISEIGDLQLHDQNVNITIVLQNKKPRTFTITWDNSTVDYLAGFKLEQKLTEASYGVGIEPWKIILPTGANIVAKDNTKMFASRYMVDEGNGTRRPVAEAMLKSQSNAQRYKSNLTITPLLVNKPTPITYSVNFSEIDGIAFRPPFIKNQSVTELVAGQGISLQQVTFPTMSNITFPVGKTWDGKSITVNSVQYDINNLPTTKFKTILNIRLSITNIPPRTLTATFENGAGYTFKSSFNRVQSNLEDTYMGEVPFARLDLPTMADIDLASTHEWDGNTFLVSTVGTRTRTQLGGMSFGQDCRISLITTPKAAPRSFNVNWDRTESEYNPGFMFNHNIAETSHGAGFMGSLIAYPSSITHKTNNEMEFSGNINVQGNTVKLLNVTYDSIKTTKFEENLLITPIFRRKAKRIKIEFVDNSGMFNYPSEFIKVQEYVADNGTSVSGSKIVLPGSVNIVNSKAIEIVTPRKWIVNDGATSVEKTDAELASMTLTKNITMHPVTQYKTFTVSWVGHFDYGLWQTVRNVVATDIRGFSGSAIEICQSIENPNIDLEYTNPPVWIIGANGQTQDINQSDLGNHWFDTNITIEHKMQPKREPRTFTIKVKDDPQFRYTHGPAIQVRERSYGSGVDMRSVSMPNIDVIEPERWDWNAGKGHLLVCEGAITGTKAQRVVQFETIYGDLILTPVLDAMPANVRVDLRIEGPGEFASTFTKARQYITKNSENAIVGSAIVLPLDDQIVYTGSDMVIFETQRMTVYESSTNRILHQFNRGEWYNINDKTFTTDLIIHLEVTALAVSENEVEVSPPRPAVYSDFVMPATAVESDYEIDGEGTMTLKVRNADWKKDRPILKDQIRSFQYEVARGDQFFNLTADDAYNSLSLVRLAGTKNYGTVVGTSFADRTSSGPFDTVAPGFGAYLAGIGDTVTGFIDNKGKLTMFIKKVGTSEHKKWFSTTIAKLKTQYPTFTYSDIFRVGWWNGISSSEGGSIKTLFKKLRVSTSWEAFNPEINYNPSEEPESRTLDPSKKYAVFAILGQSNAVGYDESAVVASDYPADPRMWTLGYREHNMELVPTNWHTMTWQDMRQYANPAGLGGTLAGTKSVGYPLGKLLLQDLPPDYELVLVSVAYGSTSVGSGGNVSTGTLVPTGGNAWGPSGSLYMTAKRRIEAVLNANPENKFIGAMYLQGESDINNTSSWRMHYSGMYNDFKNWLQSKVNTRPTLLTGTAPANSRWFFVESCSYWKSLANYQQLLSRAQDIHNGTDTYVAIPDDPNDTNNVNGTGRTSSNRLSHFGNNAYSRVVAPAIYAKLKATNAI